MNLSEKQLATGKKLITAYWISVLVVAVLFIDSNFGQKYLLFALLILLAHVVETFLFHSTLEEHSDNVIRDKFLMLPFGFLIPASRKASSLAKQAPSPDSESSD